MHKLLSSALLVLAFALPRLVLAHGTPVAINVSPQSRLATDANTYTSDLILVAGVVLTTDLPGYSIASSAAGVPNGARLTVNVVDKLWFSDGGVPGPAPAGISLSLDNFTGDSLIVTGTTGNLAAAPVGTYNSQVAGWHEHYDYTLDPAAAVPGAYGLLLQLVSPNHSELAPSAPFAVVLNNGLDDGTFNGLADDVARHALSTGDLNFDGHVNLVDVQLVGGHWMTTNPTGDANHDGIVNLVDVQTVGLNWQRTIGFPSGGAGATIGVPEPSSLVVVGIGASCAAVAAWRRRRSARRRPLRIVRGN